LHRDNLYSVENRPPLPTKSRPERYRLSNVIVNTTPATNPIPPQTREKIKAYVDSDLDTG